MVRPDTLEEYLEELIQEQTTSTEEHHPTTDAMHLYNIVKAHLVDVSVEENPPHQYVVTVRYTNEQGPQHRVFRIDPQQPLERVVAEE